MNYKYRQKCLAQKINVCHTCGDSDELVVHHINADRSDNRLENLVPLCRGCHSRLHSSHGLDGPLGDLHEKLPNTALSNNPEKEPKATTQIPVSEETRELIREEKEEYGMTYDAYLKRIVGKVDPIRDGPR